MHERKEEDPWTTVLKRQLKKARLLAELSQVRASRGLKKPQSYVSKSESGERRVLAKDMPYFARVYQQSIEFFYRADLAGIEIPDDITYDSWLAAENPKGASIQEERPTDRRKRQGARGPASTRRGKRTRKKTSAASTGTVRKVGRRGQKSGGSPTPRHPRKKR